MGSRETTGVLLLNLGGPDTPEAVRPFLYNLFSDRQIIRLGPPFMQKPLAWLISTLRYKKTAGYYRQIGGGSPLRAITEEQAGALETRLREHGNFRVYVGMRYWQPFIEETVARMKEDGVERLVSLSMYPQYSIATTGSSETSLRAALQKYPLAHAAVPAWYSHPLYIDALVDVIRKGLREGTEVLFSAHSLPVRFIEEGDPYVEHITGTIRAVSEKLDIRWHLGYQSRSGPVKWLEPSTEDALKKLAGAGARDVLMVPVSFVSDHIETLYEIDIIYKGLAEGLGMTLRRAESLNTHPVFIGALEDMVLKKAREMGWA
jgi:ferrochelatase